MPTAKKYPIAIVHVRSRMFVPPAPLVIPEKEHFIQ